MYIYTCFAKYYNIIIKCLFTQQTELLKKREDTTQLAVLSTETSELRRENATLRKYVQALHSEVFGARLAAKYLDKELAGRLAGDALIT